MKNVVLKVEEGMDPREVHATTYQMRNPFLQFADCAASEHDVHCYFTHLMAAKRLGVEGGRVLDVCCGRGLLIPFLRYSGGKRPSMYVGVDIHPRNAKWREGQDPRRRSGQVKQDWGFERVFVESDVAEMAGPVRRAVGNALFDLIVYTSSIEHMQPAAQRASLKQARSLVAPRGVMFLSCPVTPPGRSGYTTQYAAHVYEPTMSELRGWLRAARWEVMESHGLVTKAGSFRKRLKGSSLILAERMYATMPRPLALAAIGATFPRCADEVALICHPA